MSLLQEPAWTVTEVTPSQCSNIHLWVWRWGQVYFAFDNWNIFSFSSPLGCGPVCSKIWWILPYFMKSSQIFCPASRGGICGTWPQPAATPDFDLMKDRWPVSTAQVLLLYFCQREYSSISEPTGTSNHVGPWVLIHYIQPFPSHLVGCSNCRVEVFLSRGYWALQGKIIKNMNI